MTTIPNPILRGFNPDPSIVRVGEDYYIATSTFEWYPGVQIHHSKDLRHWRLLCRPLNRASQLNMLGGPDSGGIWAPCLSHADGRFWLIYTDVKRFEGRFRDTHNYLVTCDTIDGEWSDPVYLNSSGFDPSLFHDDDGRKWLVNMVVDHRPDRSPFGGILLQEYDPREQRLAGPVHNVFQGSDLGKTEGPHLYRRDGWYYLITAEGGTGYEHAVTLARSRSITGPYELHPEVHVVTARNSPHTPIQRAGHGDLVDTPGGDLYMVHLCSRPLANRGKSPLGRETAIQKVVWGEDGWLRTADGSGVALAEVPAPDLPPHPWPEALARDDFDTPELPLHYQWLRSPWPQELFSLTDRPGFLRLHGRETLGSFFHQALVARRQQAFCYTAATAVEFQPDDFQQMAGLVVYYNAQKYHYLHISHDQAHGRHLNIVSCLADPAWTPTWPLAEPVRLPQAGRVWLRADVDYERLYFAYSLDGNAWTRIPYKLDMGVVTDEAGIRPHGHFTGAFVGMCCQDITGRRTAADFDFFEYRERAYHDRLEALFSQQ
ncbi:MAG: glycoside hydrolase family 43 protein [Pseudomonadota bacterium]|nr:glycoside hydrolase family 43 protein [Pseudomonadota bacterium]